MNHFLELTEEDPVAMFTGFLVLFTAILAIVSSIQIKYLIRADKTSGRAADAATQAAVAAMRALTKDRAYIFVDYLSHSPFTTTLTPQMPKGTAHYDTTITYRISNYGSTPAIIKNITSYGFMKNRHLDDMELKEPDPSCENDIIKFRSKGPMGPRIIEIHAYFGSPVKPRQVILNGNGAYYTVEHQLFFQSRNFDPNRKIHHIWILFSVDYADIYGNSWTTSYYAEAGGAAGAYSTNNRIYNYRT